MSKSDWGPGQWQNEPDYDEWLDPFTGWQCFLWRHPTHGHWCGYVDVPDEAIRNWQPTTQLQNLFEDHVRVHGGVTFCERRRDADVIRVGFDTSHFSDYSPGLYKAVRDRMLARNLGHLTYRNHAYCWLETFQMCQQIAELLDV